MLWLFSGSAMAGPDYFSTGNGQSGVLTVNAGQNVVVNSYTGLAGNASVAATSVTVDDASAFSAGDLVLFWQAAGHPNPGTATQQNTVDITATSVGQFEFARITGVNTGTDVLTLVDPLTNAFAAATTQVVRVPEYQSATIAATGSVSAEAWNGDTGGIVVFLVNGALVNNGTISAAGLGFRGGTERGNSGANGCTALDLPANPTQTDYNRSAQKGEGIVSSRFGADHRARANVVNAGGGGVCHNSGGGGGGHAGNGGQGGLTWRDDNDGVNLDYGRDVPGFGGVGLAYDPTARMTLGGGGGAGQMNNNLGGAGGAGGGVVLLRVGSLSGTGALNANGANGLSSTGAGNDSAGGAGAGGSVVVHAAGSIACTTATADGGQGGVVVADDHGPGGGGGGGYVRLRSLTVTCARSVAGGANGTQTQASDPNGPAYGATSGSSGSEAIAASSLPVDSDQDGIPDVEEGATDSDGDSVPNYLDADDDNDGILTSVETNADTDGDGIPNHLDKDSDNDGIPDVVEAGAVDGGDGVLDGFTDANSDGVDDTLAGAPLVPPNSDGSGPPDYLDLDSDGDGIPDATEVGLPVGDDGRVAMVVDADGDGLHDTYPTTQPNTDSDGLPDYLDLDSDEDGISDGIEAFDTDGDGTQDTLPLGNDHDGDGIDDQYDADCPGGVGCAGGSTSIGLGALTPAQDANGNGTPDWLETCVDGYVTAGEACDDGDADDSNACSNSCLLNLGQICTGDAECISALCEANACAACRDDVNGGTDTGCDATNPICRGSAGTSSCGTCADTEAGTGTDEGCAGNTPQCDVSAAGGVGACVGCTLDGNCDDADACTSNSCSGGACVFTALTPGAACLDGTPGQCDANGTCVANCTDDADCGGALPHCDTSLTVSSCVACLNDAHCEDSNSCTTDACVAGACANTAVAAGAPCLDGEAGTCDSNQSCVEPSGGCESNADCSGAEPVCDITQSPPRCVECVADTDCSGNETCSGNSCDDSELDTDGDGVPDVLDPDDDNDGILDVDELGGEDLSGDSDGDGVRDYADPDAVGCDDEDSDGTCDRLPRSVDADGDGVPNHLDLDSDGDGIVDLWENGGALLDDDRDGVLDNILDSDGDGLTAAVDDDDDDPSVTTTRPPLDTDGDGLPDHLDLDADGDGISDVTEANGVDTNGDGKQDGTDGDGNGLVDQVDPGESGTPLDPPDTDGDGDFDFQDVDSDDDGFADSVEGFDSDGDGRPDREPSGRDDDGDGWDDTFGPPDGEAAPLPDSDGDGIPDFRDDDDDDDGTPTVDEGGDDPDDPVDADDDGIPDYLDPTLGARPDAGVPPVNNGGDTDSGASTDDTDPRTDEDDIDVDSGSGSDDPARFGLAGGAGCAVGTPSHGSGWLAMALLASALAGVRRRRQRLIAAAVAVSSLGLLSSSSQAQQAGFTLNRYRPAETTTDSFQLSRPTAVEQGKLSAQLFLDYANDPLVAESAGTADSEFAKLVAHQLAAHATFSYAVVDDLLVFVGVPVNVVMSGDDLAGAASADGASLGDPWLGGRYVLLGSREDLVALAAQAGITVPLAKLADGQQGYAGDSTVTGHPELVFELRPGNVAITANLGALIKEKTQLTGTAVGSELTFGLGASTHLSKPFEVMAELYGASVFTGFFDREATPLEALVGGKYTFDSGFTAGLAGGPGITRGVGSPDLRVVALIGWATPDEPVKPAPPVEAAPTDIDGDGLFDDEDECRSKPEDKDGFEDEDGCPDPDNDKDGLPDAKDQCPNEPEDTDDFEDENGCPDPDNDQDGVPDVSDECLMEPEDKDDFEDENGCPDPDNDQDSVKDTDDDCPLVAGAADNAGCPKKIRVEKTQIVILERVEFATGKDVILERSYPTLEEVRAVLKSAPYLKKLRVEGHTDDRGSDASNLELSVDRARSVKVWLVGSGIEAERLEAYGCGETRPIDDNKTAAGRQTNRRVEFHVLDPAPPQPRSTDGCVDAD